MRTRIGNDATDDARDVRRGGSGVTRWLYRLERNRTRDDNGVLGLAVGGLDGDVTVQADDADVTVSAVTGVDGAVVVRGDGGDAQFEGDAFDSVSSTEGRTRAEIWDGGDQLTIDVDDADVHLDTV